MTTAGELINRIEQSPTPLALLRRTAQEQPFDPAIVYMRTPMDPEPQTVTYQALLEQVESAHRAFTALDIGSEDGIAMLLPAVPEGVVVLLAGAEAGVVFPINPLLSSDALRSQLCLARARIAVVSGSPHMLDVRKRLDAAKEGLSNLSVIVEVPDEGASAGALSWRDFIEGAQNETSALEQQDSNRVGALFHSGGTTGAPKLVQLSLRNLVAGAVMSADVIQWRRRDRLLMALPLFHVAGAIDSALASIAAGACLILPTPQGARHPAFMPNVWSMIEHVQASILGLVPASLTAAANVPVGAANLHSLRAIVTGSAPISGQVVARIQSMTRRPVCQVYGMTETAGIIAAQPADGAFREPAVGSPAKGMQVRICTDESAPAGLGEVCVQGPNVFLGYREVGDGDDLPIDDWLPTGDIGEIRADGQLYLRSRRKDVIIRSGHNIDPLIIEEAALSHPSVRQAVAVPMPDAYAGELPALYLTLQEGTETSADSIHQHVSSRIADLAARPRHTFVIDELPLTLIGKVARFKLRQAAAEHVARHTLQGLPITEITCTGASANEIEAIWSPKASETDRLLADDLLGQLGLTLVG